MLIPMGFLAASGAGAAGAYDLISTSLISSTTASVTFSSLPADYSHLQIRWTGRSNRSDYQDRMAIRLNGVTSNTYISHVLRGSGSNVASVYQDAFGYIFATGVFDLFATTETSGAFGAGIIDILDFKNTSKTKTVRMFSGLSGGTQARNIALTSGMNTATGALSSITLFPQNGSWVAGSRMSIYGIKGA